MNGEDDEEEETELVIYSLMRGKSKICEIESRLPRIPGGRLTQVKVVLDRYILAVRRGILVMIGTAASHTGKVTLDLDYYASPVATAEAAEATPFESGAVQSQ